MKSPVTAILASLSLGTTIYAAPAEQDTKHDLESVFDVDWSTNKNGGCDQEIKKSIQQSYSEAMDAIGKTLGELEWLAGLKVEPKSGDEHDRYIRITEAFEPVFGADAWTDDNGLSQAGKSVQAIYEAYLEHHTMATKKPTYLLRCGDSGWLTYLKPTDPDPRENGKPDANEYTLAAPRPGKHSFPHGALYAPGLPKRSNLIYVKEPPADPNEPLCRKKDRVMASSNKPNSLLVLCYRAIMPRPPNVITFPADAAKDQELDKITELALATTWIHEMGHYVYGWPEPHVNGEPVYHWRLVTELAKQNSKASLQAPEAFALFATIMYYDRWHWATGKAKWRSGLEHASSTSSPKPKSQQLKVGSPGHNPSWTPPA